MIMSQQKSKILMEEGYEIEIAKDWYNSLLNRRELEIVIMHMGKGTPDRKTIRNFIAKYFNIDIERIIVKKIESEFGWCRTKAHVHIYDTPELTQKIEPPHIIRRHGKEVKKST